MHIEVLVDLKSDLGESPIWSAREERLYWVDGVAKRLYRCTASGGELRAWALPETIGSFALRAAGGAIVALETGLRALDFDTGEVTQIIDFAEDSGAARFNDGKTDRQGRWLVGTMARDEVTPLGQLFRLDADLSLNAIDSGLVVVNGPCLSPAGCELYCGDSGAGVIWTYDYDPAAGTATRKHVFARPDPAFGGAPDGSTVDSEGFLWNAEIFAGRIVRYAPDGRIDRIIPMPVRKITSLVFGGDDLGTLFVTSMGSRLLPHFPPDGPTRGSLFAITGLGVRGLPETPFAG